MNLSKTIALPGGQISLSASGKVCSIGITESASAGGGEAAGILAVSGNATLTLNDKQAFDLGMALIEAHSPAPLVPLEQMAQAAGDAALST